MSKRNYCSFAIAATALFLGWTLIAEQALSVEKETPPKKKSLFQRLTSEDPQERKAAKSSLRNLENRRKETVQTLIRLLKHYNQPPNSNKYFQKRLPIELLGEYRAVEARKILAQDIDYKYPSVTSQWPLSAYPAAYALVKIGSPAVPVVIGRLNDSLTETELKLIAYVLLMIEADHGYDLEKEVVLFRLRRLKDQTENGTGERKENLKRLIDFFETADLTHPKNWPGWGKPEKETDSQK